MERRSKMELLAPAGGADQLAAAIQFGADAVYLAADRFGMRARAANFSMEELPEAVSLAHDAGIDVHLTSNILMMEEDIDGLPDFFERVNDAGVDALIIGDLGAFALAKEHAPDCALHVSTQASVSNAEAAKIWHSLGARRIVCAREMTLSDIARMKEEIPEDLEIEVFVHGAQCMAVSGRCLISSYLTGRSGNQGNCTQPCRWSYTLEEEKRPGIHFPVEEDEDKTFIMNAKDLCMIDHLRELKDAGVDSVKIEGRNKKAFYVAHVVGAYRRALDALEQDAYNGDLIEELYGELRSASHRPFSTGFYFGEPEQAPDFDGYEQDTIHVADVVGCGPLSDCPLSISQTEGRHPSDILVLRCRNRFDEGDMLEIMSPNERTRELKVTNLRWIVDSDHMDDLDGSAIRCEKVETANRSCNLYMIDSDLNVEPGSFVRQRKYRRSARHS